jgi:hypothetical protein
MGGWRKLHDEELRNFYSSPSAVRLMRYGEGGGRKWAIHVARMEEKGKHVGYWWQSQKESVH